MPRQVYLDCETEAVEISNSRDMVRLMVRLTAILLEAVSATSSEAYAHSAAPRNQPLRAASKRCAIVGFACGATGC